MERTISEGQRVRFADLAVNPELPQDGIGCGRCCALPPRLCQKMVNGGLKGGVKENRGDL